MHSWHRIGAVLLAATAALGLTAVARAEAGLLPGITGGQSASEPSPPPALWTVEGEQLAGANTVAVDPTAHGGRLGRTTSEVFAPSPLDEGSYLVVARVRGPASGGRLDLTSDHAMLGSWQLPSGGWVLVSAVVHQPVVGHLIGVAAYAPPGRGVASPVDVDWIALQRTDPTYTVRGTEILDPSGRAIVLKGVNRAGYQRWTHGGTQFNQGVHEAAQVERWGADVVRIQLNQDFWLADCRAYDPHTTLMSTYRSVISSEVHEFTSRGIYTILDLHQLNGSVSTRCLDNPAQGLRPMADGNSPEFWRSVAAAMRGNPLVGFDLFNEPHDIDDDTWKDGGRPDALTMVRTVGMQDLYEAVRSTGAQNLVFVSGREWATDIDVAVRRPLNGYGIVLAPHLYCHSSTCTTDSLDDSLSRMITNRALARHPVLVTEFGSDDPSNGDFQAWATRYANARNIGWVAYAWQDSATSSDGYGLFHSFGRRVEVKPGVTTYAPNAAGSPLWNDLATRRVERGYWAALVG